MKYYSLKIRDPVVGRGGGRRIMPVVKRKLV